MDPIQEARRIERLHALGILDTADDGILHGLAQQAIQLLPGTCIAAVTLVDADRQWFKTMIGLDIKQTPRNQSFCSHTIQADDTMVVEDAILDERFAQNPLVNSPTGIRFYAGVKLTGGIGALCVIGRKPRKATEPELFKLAKLAQYVDIHLMAHGALFNLQRAF